MPDPTETLTLPRELVDRALALGERDVDATEALAEKVDAYRAEVRPIVDAYGLDLAARAKARAEADAERLESRSAFARLATGKPAMAIYGVLLALVANYFVGLAGIAPPEIKAALSEVADAPR